MNLKKKCIFKMFIEIHAWPRTFNNIPVQHQIQHQQHHLFSQQQRKEKWLVALIPDYDGVCLLASVHFQVLVGYGQDHPSTDQYHCQKVITSHITITVITIFFSKLKKNYMFQLLCCFLSFHFVVVVCFVHSIPVTRNPLYCQSLISFALQTFVILFNYIYVYVPITIYFTNYTLSRSWSPEMVVYFFRRQHLLIFFGIGGNGAFLSLRQSLTLMQCAMMVFTDKFTTRPNIETKQDSSSSQPGEKVV